MSCKQYIISLIEELLNLFETNTNKLVYRQLILIRHKVRNLYTQDEIIEYCKSFYYTNIRQFKQNDISIFNETSYAVIVELVWNELSIANKEVIWKWVDRIIQNITNEDNFL